MRKVQIIVLSVVVLGTVGIISAFQVKTFSKPKVEVEASTIEENQMINMFVTHGHCSTPFTGEISDLKIATHQKEGAGNPLEDMAISFSIDPQSFNECGNAEGSKRVKTPGLFIGKKNEKITFKSTRVHTMGLDWYEVNGNMSIKGIEKEVKFFVSGIRDPKESMASKLVLEGQLDLMDYGIDYDLIVYGESNEHPTKWLHLNMKVDLPSGC